MENNKNSNGVNFSLSLGTIVFIVFLVLKLTGVIDWSWWWVVSPLLIELGFALAVILVVVIVMLLTMIGLRTGRTVARGIKKRRRKHYDKE